MNQKCFKWRKISYILYVVALIVFSVGCYFEYGREIYEQSQYIKIKEYYSSFFIEDKPKDDITKVVINKYINKIDKVNNNKKKKELKIKTDKLYNYIEVRDLINSSYKDNILLSSVTEKDLNNINEKYNNLDDKYKSLLKNKIDNMNKQFSNIELLKKSVDGFFEDKEKQHVKTNVKRNKYNDTIDLLHKVKQEDIKNEQMAYLQIVNEVLLQKEDEEAKIYQEKVNNAWVKYDVSYISQNYNNVLNGCELASLLMCLKYKGYLQSKTLQDYANEVVKSDDPYTGFYSDIYNIQPTNIVHWIAPEPLAEFGRKTSGNNNITNTTGYSLEQLDNELQNGNLVVIYLTSKLKKVKKYNDDIPKNLHVLALVGYNKVTGEQILVDPWTNENESYEKYVSKDKIESIYNEVGRKSVVVG